MRNLIIALLFLTLPAAATPSEDFVRKVVAERIASKGESEKFVAAHPVYFEPDLLKLLKSSAYAENKKAWLACDAFSGTQGRITKLISVKEVGSKRVEVKYTCQGPRGLSDTSFTAVLSSAGKISDILWFKPDHSLRQLCEAAVKANQGSR